MNKSAFTILKINSVDEDQRIIRGIATTPTPDRVGDVVDPMGLKFKNPSPLLWMHDHQLPVGTVVFGTPTKKGIPFEAKIPVIEGPSQLKARVDEAWMSVKTGLVACVSIGFNALKWAVNEATGGYIFLESELLELSLVTIPANPDAIITGIKSMDTEIRAAFGKVGSVSLKKEPSGVSETSKPVKLTPKEAPTMNIKEQIKAFQSERSAKYAEMESIMKKAADAGETLDEQNSETYDTLESEVGQIDKHLVRLGNMEKAQNSTTKAVGATVVGEVDTEEKAIAARVGTPIRAVAKQEPGIAFARLAKCKALGKLEHVPAFQIADALYKDDPRISNILKATIPAATTDGATWAKPLVGDETSIYADFIEFLRPLTIIGKFGAAGVPALRRVPFRVPLIGQTSGGSAAWVGEGAPKPLTKFDFARQVLEPLKVATIAVATMEVIRDSSPSADAIIRDQLAAAVRERQDIDFIDPNKAASAGVSPASITNGVTPIASTGSDADAIRCDLQALFSVFIAANNAPTTGVFVMSSVTALALSLMRNPLGQAEFPGITMMGGILSGLPVIVSEYVPTDTDGSYVFLINANDVYLADDGDVTVDMSQEASLQMLDNPTNNSATGTATTMVSMFQTNSVAFRAERTINWSRRRASAVAVLSGVNWGDCFS